jgi:hypothetical protein
VLAGPVNEEVRQMILFHRLQKYSYTAQYPSFNQNEVSPDFL